MNLQRLLGVAGVLVREMRRVVAEAECLIERHRVIELAVDEHDVARRPQVEGVRERAGRRGGIQVGRVVRLRAEHVDVERRLVLDQAPAGAAAEVDVPLGSPHRHERAAPAQRVVAHADVREVANGSETRLRDDFDRRAAGVVVLGGELIARDADRSNLRLRGQRGALEAIDADDGAGPGHVLQLLLQNRGIVGERLDLIASERGAERRAVAIGRRFLLVKKL